MKNIIEYGSQLRPALQAYIADQTPNMNATKPWGEDFLVRLQRFAGSGKLLRGGLVCFAYRAFSGRDPDEVVYKAAMALELTHSALLIHDDVMDNDELRRGQPSLHQQYRQLGVEQGLHDPKQFGISLAICGGDAALFMAFELLSEVQAAVTIPLSVNHLFVTQLTEVCTGQMQDIYFDARPILPSKSAIYGLMKAKTASYTLALPLIMGAALAGERTATIRHLEEVGAAAGTIFQIRDDELGLLGDTATTGKPVGSDIREGKKTLPYYYLIKRATAADRRKLQDLFGNPALAPADVAYVQQLVRAYDIPTLLGKDIDRLATQAHAAIAALTIDSSAQTELNDLVAFCGRRQS